MKKRLCEIKNEMLNETISLTLDPGWSGRRARRGGQLARCHHWLRGLRPDSLRLLRFVAKNPVPFQTKPA